MDISFKIESYEINREFELQVMKKVAEIIEPKVDKLISETSANDVAKIVLESLRHTLEYEAHSMRNGGVADMFRDRITEISKGITDEELKNFLLTSFVSQVRSR